MRKALKGAYEQMSYSYSYSAERYSYSNILDRFSCVFEYVLVGTAEPIECSPAELVVYGRSIKDSTVAIAKTAKPETKISQNTSFRLPQLHIYFYTGKSLSSCRLSPSSHVPDHPTTIAQYTDHFAPRIKNRSS